MKLFIWHISGPVVTRGTAISLASTKAEAIEAICEGIEDEEIRVPLREDLEDKEPDVEVVLPIGWFAKKTN